MRDTDARTARNAYTKAWRRNNRKKSRAASRSWNERNKERLKVQYVARMETLEGRAQRLLDSARSRARVKGLECTLDRESIVVTLALGRCQATGLPLDLRSSNDFTVNPFAPSLDRVDTKSGYTVDNTRLVCAAFNTARGEWGDEILSQLATAFMSHRETEAYAPSL